MKLENGNFAGRLCYYFHYLNLQSGVKQFDTFARGPKTLYCLTRVPGHNRVTLGGDVISVTRNIVTLHNATPTQ